MKKLATYGVVDTIGLDVGDRSTAFCEVRDRKVVQEASFRTTRDEFARFLSARTRCRVVLEVGKHSPWMWDALRAAGFEAFLVNPAKLFNGDRRRRKTDRIDAHYFADRGSSDDRQLTDSRTQHREVEHRLPLQVLRLRADLVRNRTASINAVRGTVKTWGAALARTSTAAFLKQANLELIPPQLRGILGPMLEQIAALNTKIADYDRMIEQIAERDFPIVARVMQISGVGIVTALHFVLTVGRWQRFANGRAVAAYFGLAVGVRDSGEKHPILGITKAGDRTMRVLLIQCAQHILRISKHDCDLKRFGLRVEGGSKDRVRRRKAVVALARKLAVVMFHLLKTGATYDPFFSARKLDPNLPKASTQIVDDTKKRRSPSAELAERG